METIKEIAANLVILALLFAFLQLLLPESNLRGPARLICGLLLLLAVLSPLGELRGANVASILDWSSSSEENKAQELINNGENWARNLIEKEKDE